MYRNIKLLKKNKKIITTLGTDVVTSHWMPDGGNRR